MFNSIICCIKDQKDALKTYLETLSRAAHRKPYELILIDLKSDQAHWHKKLVDEYEDRIPIEYEVVNNLGFPHRSKGFNFALSIAQGEYVTVTEPGHIFPQRFLMRIEEHLSEVEPEYADIFLHECRYLDAAHTEMIDRSLDIFGQAIVPNPQQHQKRKWKVGKHENEEIWPTVKTAVAMQLGGFDERFIGMGAEMVDFAWGTLGTVWGDNNETCPLFHRDAPELALSKEHLAMLEDGGKPPETDDWGTFPE